MEKHDFALHLLTGKIKSITEEQKRLTQKMLKSRRDEQFEIDHIRMRFAAQIRAHEAEQHRLAKELERRERELTALRKRIKDEEEEEQEETQKKSGRHLRKY